MPLDTERLAGVLTQLNGQTLETMPLCVLVFLHDAKGRVVSYEALMDFVESCRPPGFTADTLTIHGHCKKIRRAIELYDWPVSLKNHRSIGYQLIVADPTWRLDPP